MQRDWTADELILHWTLQAPEQAMVGNKTSATRLGFAILLKFFQFMGCFPRHAGEVPAAAVEHVAQQVGVPHELWPDYQWQGRTIEYHRAQIRFLLGFREATVSDGTALTAWLIEKVGPYGRHVEQLKVALLEQCRSQKIEPPTADRIDRLVHSAIHTYDERLCEAVWQRVPPDTRVKLNALLLPSLVAPEPAARIVPALLQELRADALPLKDCTNCGVIQSHC